MSINHCMADGISAMEFIKSWAETARGMPLTTKPVLDRSILRSRQPPKIDFPFGQAGELIKNPLSFAVEEVQNGIKMVNEEFVRSWIDYFEEMRAKDVPLLSHFIVSSWTRLPIECADFGWGEPAQFGCANLPKDSVLFLPEGKEKKGINLILDLPVTAMSTFQELMLL
ncbi:hypothetical protein NC651_032713 [Populus alba x Populus x berolinensis]|nr:hypothetical protein NC651_032713 [Populus alba x Populus x berolinensis]